MPLYYLDASIGIQALLDTPHRQGLIAWIDQPQNAFVSSRLLRTEIARVLWREGQSVLVGEPLLSRIGLFDVTEKTHQLAEAITTHVKTLDALHLATALLIPEVVTVATHDMRMAGAAALLGLPTLDPIEALPA